MGLEKHTCESFYKYKITLLKEKNESYSGRHADAESIVGASLKVNLKSFYTLKLSDHSASTESKAGDWG